MSSAIAAALHPAQFVAPGVLGTMLGIASVLSPSLLPAATTYYVNTSGDPGPDGSLSLRQAVAAATLNADPNVSILFEEALAGSTITLAQGAIPITRGLSITGLPASPRISISGAGASRIFEVTAGQSPIYLSRLDLTQGHATGCGGAIFEHSGHIVLRESSVSDSTAASGGGICAVATYAPDSQLALYKTRITGNSAVLGGGMYLKSAGLSAIQSTISGNTALGGGGGLYAIGGGVTIRYSLISGNSVPSTNSYIYTSMGGGIASANVFLSVGQSTFYGNYAYSSGSAIAVLGSGYAHLLNVTVAGNVTHAAGAIATVGVSPGLANSIVANNTGGDLSGTFLASYSLVTDPAQAQLSGINNIFGADPLLSKLADHGGPTLTMLPAVGSPVIGAGHENGNTEESPRSDQRRFPAVGSVDIGAVERQYPEEIVFRNGFESI